MFARAIAVKVNVCVCKDGVKLNYFRSSLTKKNLTPITHRTKRSTLKESSSHAESERARSGPREKRAARGIK